MEIVLGMQVENYVNAERAFRAQVHPPSIDGIPPQLPLQKLPKPLVKYLL